MTSSQSTVIPVIRPRRAWLAALLSLVGAPVGHIYCGRPKRAFAFWLAGMCLAPLVAFCIVTFPMGRVSVLVMFCAAFSFYFVQAADAAVIARRTPPIELRRYQRWWVYIAIVVLSSLVNNANALLVKTFIAEAFTVPTRGMSPTVMPGDRFLVDKLWANPRKIKRNSIVTFRSPEDESSIYVMRVIALSGDTIYMKDSKVFVNDQEVVIPESHFDGETPSWIDTKNLKQQTIGADSFFVLGDHRNMSLDSRFFGSVPTRNYYGEAVMIFWSTPYVFPDPKDWRSFEAGPIAWSRIGSYLR